MEWDRLTDEALMQRYCGGEAAAFEALYLRYEKPLYRFIRRLLGSHGEAQVEDVFQDTWMRLINARERWELRSDAGFKTWLYTLAHHRAVDVLRVAGRELPVETDEAESGEDPWRLWPAPQAGEPQERAFWQRAGAQLLACIDRLPLPQRAAFLLHHEDGLALNEMATVLETEFETVKSRLRYALAKLRTCMGAYAPPMNP